MKTAESYLRDIDKLRQRHTALFHQGKWAMMDTVRRKIQNNWDAYHRAVLSQKPAQPGEFQFYVVNSEFNQWSTRHRTKRAAILSHRKLSNHGSYRIESIPAGDPARFTKKTKP